MGWASSASNCMMRATPRTLPVISTDASRVTVRVIPTDEELMIARSVSRLLGLDVLHYGR